MKTHTEKLLSLNACSDAREWAEQQPDAQTAWNTCERGDWMLWLLGKLSGPVGSPERKRLVFLCAQVAREVLPLFEKRYPDDKRVRECIEACEAYSRGEIDAETLREKRRAAYDAAADAAYAAYAAAYADAAAYAAAYAYAYADAAAAAYAAAAHKSMQKRIADIVRAHVPQSPI